jgi:hypothetical protein
MTAPSIQQLVALIWSEYLEIPRLRLTRAQVERLWAIDPATTDAVLRILVNAHFLAETGRHAYVRAAVDARAAGLPAATRAIGNRQLSLAGAVQ